MNTTDYVLRVYRRDYRYRTGERLVVTERHDGVTADWIRDYARGVQESEGVARVEYQEQWVTVRNLMSGQAVTIAADTPWCCNPASETYWTM
jgi:hypothetical protein